MTELEELYVSQHVVLKELRAKKEELQPRWKELNELDNNGYSTVLNELVNKRTKAEEREFNNLGKILTGLNYRIRGLQMSILDVGQEILKDIAKKAEQK